MKEKTKEYINFRFHLNINVLKNFTNCISELKQKEIKFKTSQSFSTPKRLVFVINEILEEIEQKGKVLKGPKVEAPKEALEGFKRSNNLQNSDIYKKKIEKGEFYFAEIKPKVINILEELQSIVPQALKDCSWKKSMKWSGYDLSWGRPLKSIIALFNNKIVNFNFFHLQSSNLTFVNGTDEEKIKKIEKIFL